DEADYYCMGVRESLARANPARTDTRAPCHGFPRLGARALSRDQWFAERALARQRLRTIPVLLKAITPAQEAGRNPRRPSRVPPPPRLRRELGRRNPGVVRVSWALVKAPGREGFPVWRIFAASRIHRPDARLGYWRQKETTRHDRREQSAEGREAG